MLLSSFLSSPLYFHTQEDTKQEKNLAKVLNLEIREKYMPQSEEFLTTNLPDKMKEQY
jgi:hypothetical protein